MKRVTVIEHPVVQHHLTRLRAVGCGPDEFRRGLEAVATLLGYEATSAARTRTVRVRTPLQGTTGRELPPGLLLVPLLRAGLGMLPGLRTHLPGARVGFVGVKRHETTLEPAVYHRSLPRRLAGTEVIVLDPMLATGGSAVAALELLWARGARRVSLVHLVAAPAGIRRVHARFPAVRIFVAAVDRGLNDRGYIVPGLGDAGDRLFDVEGGW